MRRLCPAIALATLSLEIGCAPHQGLPNGGQPAATWTAGTTTHDVAVGSIVRSYLLHVPAQRPRNAVGVTQLWPLVIVLHGSNAHGDDVEHSSGMDSAADARRFLVAYPNALKGPLGLFPTDWNAGSCCGSAERENVDDVGFVDELIAQVAGHLQVDRHRIYVAGFSDGGRLAYRIACERADAIAAIGVVSGSLLDAQCAPTRPMPLIAFHGTSDHSVPYDDSARAIPRYPPPPSAAALPSAVRFWAGTNGCGPVVLKRQSPHVTLATLTPCDGADIAMYTIEGGVHGWPGEPDGAGSEPPMSEVHATNLMVAFFFLHHR